MARVKAELELAEADGTAPPVDRLLEDLDEAFVLLTAAEDVDDPRPRVIVVDDDMRLAEITARGLRRLGFAADSSAVIEGVGTDVVLVLDLGMLEGLDAATMASMRAARPIIVTGAADRASRALAEDVAASDYLVKPIELEDLAAAINRRVTASS